jgi:hypothetical protein
LVDGSNTRKVVKGYKRDSKSDHYFFGADCR